MRAASEPKTRMAKRAIGLALVFLGGCSLALNGAALNPPYRGGCSVSADCSGGAVCMQGFCTGGGGPGYPLRLEFVTAASSTGAAISEVEPVDPSFDALSGPPLLFQLGGPSAVSGLVQTAAGAGIAAQVSFGRPGDLPGQPPILVTATSQTDGTFQIPLRPASYDALVVPTGNFAQSYPPLRRPVLVSTAASQSVQFVYPARLLTLRGTVEDASGRPQPSIQVAAVDASAADANVVSTTALSDASLNTGTFSIVVPGDAMQVFLLLRPTDANPLFPTTTVGPIAMPTPTGSTSDVVDLGPGAVRFPPAGVPVQASGLVTGTAASGGTGGVDGVTLAFTSGVMTDSTGRSTGRFLARSVSQADGSFTVALLPGAYAVAAAPPSVGYPAEEFALTQASVSIDTASGPPVVTDVRIDLDRRADLAGSLFDAQHMPVWGASVHALPLGAGPMPQALPGRAGDATVGTDGRFRLPLDPGVYDVVFRATDASRLPWTVFAHESVVAGGVTLDAAVAPPLLVRGILSDPAGAPASGVLVRAWAIVDARLATERAVMVGSASTDAMGAFAAIVPATTSP